MSGRRVTYVLVLLAGGLLSDPFGRHYGYELGKRVNLRSGVVYPALSRMLEDGWLTDGWEERAGGRRSPPRRYYQLTDKGRQVLRGVLDDAAREGRFAGLLDQLGTIR